MISGSVCVVSEEESQKNSHAHISQSPNNLHPRKNFSEISEKISEKFLTTNQKDFTHKELVLGYITSGEFIGEMGVFFPSIKRHVTLKTRVISEIAEIKHDKLMTLLCGELINDCPKILFAIGSQISKRLLSASRKASGLAFIDVTERIMRAVIELSQSQDALTHPDGMQIKASRQELAKLSGCSREMAGRALKELEAEKRLTAKGKTIVVFGTR